MSLLHDFHETLSVTDAAEKGVSGLIRSVENGEGVIVSRHGRPVAAVVGIGHLDELRTLESDLRDLALVMTRAATDSGRRTDLDDAITAFGFTRDELEAELAVDETADDARTPSGA